MDKKNAVKIISILKKEYPNIPKSFLEFENPFQLLISVILSAQCTDKMVNIVTPKLFAKFPDARSLGGGNIEEIMELIKPTGFYKNKAANIKKCAAELMERHKGRVPETMEELTALSGVGRKTANVVLQIAFDSNIGVVIDTHVKRLSNRIGFSSNDDPEKIETDLMAIIDEAEWKNFSFYLIMHGRAVCDAKKPDCAYCVLSPHCAYFKSGAGEKKSDGPKTGAKKTNAPRAKKGK